MENSKDSKGSLQDEVTNRRVAEYLGISYDEYKKSGGRIEQDTVKPSLYIVYFDDDLPVNILSKIKGIDTLRNFVVLPENFFSSK